MLLNRNYEFTIKVQLETTVWCKNETVKSGTLSDGLEMHLQPFTNFVLAITVMGPKLVSGKKP